MAQPLAMRFDIGNDPVAHIRFISANSQLHLHLIRNDVVLGAAMNRSDRYHDRIERIVLAARDCLQRVDNFGRKHDRILGLVRIGAVPADASHRDSTESTFA